MSLEMNEHIRNRLARLDRIEEAGVSGYPNDFTPEHTTEELRAAAGDTEAEALQAEPVPGVIAGRIMTLRVMGKASFFHLKDRAGTLQVFVRRDAVGEAEYGIFKKFEVGDIVGVRGALMRTRTGELSLAATEVRILSKAIRPLPEKFHGLQDVEARYRQRYVDLIVNDDVREVFRVRAGVIKHIRQTLDERGFMEVETPMMHPVPGGAAARPFITHHNALDIDLYLRIAPELYLKRLLVGGMERVYEINRNFRNEGLSPRHNPEFTMLEFYQAYATYEDLMDFTEALITGLAQSVLGTLQVPFGEDGILDLSPPWPRLDLRDAVREAAGLSADALEDPAALRAWLKARDVDAPAGWGPGKLLAEVYDVAVEPTLVNPTFIIHHPVEISPLARRNGDDPSITDRFELIIGGREIANAFSELNDPRDQRARFEAQIAAKAAGDDEAHGMDTDFLRALEYGMPPAAGEGIGIDRLVMLLTNRQHIKEVILFPLLRPEAE